MGIRGIATVGRQLVAGPLRARESGRATSLPLPTFLSIGAPQSGTTWLHANLALHPDVDVPVKEVCYFTYHFHRPLSWYAAAYDPTKPVRGDLTPHYLRLHPRRIAMARRLLPNAKLVLLSRDPVERAWSEVRRKIGSSPTPSEVAAYFDRTRRQTRRWFDPEVENSSTEAGVANWLVHYPASALVQIDFEDINDDPHGVIAAVLDHVGADRDRFPWHRLVVQRVNKNPAANMPDDVFRMLWERYSARS